jgi:hypothetical protein
MTEVDIEMDDSDKVTLTWRNDDRWCPSHHRATEKDLTMRWAVC